ncbi:MAG: hypothetical protein ABWK00_05915 [Desulfurococcaceae archaeon]
MELADLAGRVLKALEHYECFIFERAELERVRELVAKAELAELVSIRRVDPRYEDIMVLAPRTRDLEAQCVSWVQQLLAQGSIGPEEYKRDRLRLLEQCVRSRERERVRELMDKLRKYLERLSS